jgi:hypothetical protein
MISEQLPVRQDRSVFCGTVRLADLYEETAASSASRALTN